MTESAAIPKPLADLLTVFDGITDRDERSLLLLDYADRFREVPASVARRPFPEKARVPFCESEAFVWAIGHDDGTLQLYFAVENPSGVSAKALCAILDKTLSGLPASEVALVDADIVQRIFQQNVSMGKGLGLMGIVLRVAALARAAILPLPARQNAL